MYEHQINPTQASHWHLFHDLPLSPFLRLSLCLCSLAASRLLFFQARLLSPRFSQNHLVNSVSSFVAPASVRGFTGLSMDESSESSSSFHFICLVAAVVSGVGAALRWRRSCRSCFVNGVNGVWGSAG